MVGVDILQKDDPYHLPGYTGFCPQAQYVCGENFGELTHNLLLDPAVNHSEKLALVDRKKDHELKKPKKADIDTVNSRVDRTDIVYKNPILSSYEGFVPRIGELRDKPYGTQAIEGIAKFEREQLKERESRARLKKIIDLQSGSKFPENLEERLLLQSKFKLPLIAVRPECIGLQKSHPVDEKYVRPRDYSTSPYFMENSNPQKYIINGYTGYIPYKHYHIGKSNKYTTRSGLQEFTNKYKHKQNTEWAPINVSDMKPKPHSSDPDERHMIYKKDTALMPSYSGHVPGAMFKIGKTYGHTTKHANQFLEEHLFNLKLSKCFKKIKLEQDVK